MARIEEEEIQELKDHMKFLESALERISETGDRFVEKIISSARQSVNLKNVFEELVDTLDDLPKNILNAKDLEEAIVKDAKLFQKIQKETNLLTEKAFADGEKKIRSQLQALNTHPQEIEKHISEYKDTTHSITQEFDKQFLLLQREAKEVKKIQVSFLDVKKELDKIGAAARAPGQAIDNMLGNISSMPSKIRSASETAGGFGKLLIQLGLKARVFFGPVGLLVLGFGALLGPIIVAFKALKNMFDFVDKKVMPATASLNREFGNMGINTAAIKKEAISAGVQFEFLGKSFSDGASAVTQLFSAMMHVPGPTKAAAKETAEFTKTGLKLSEYVGLGAESAGKLLLQAQRAGVSMKDFNKTMTEASDIAGKYGVPVNQIRKDMGENVEILSRFGIKNRMTFLESAARARSYGLSIREVSSAFGQQLDTFENSADAAAKLNTIFGTHINSYKLMLETDPTKRMEMLREELIAQGKSWDSLNTFEQNVITSSLQVNKEQAALVLSSDKVRRKLMAENAEKKKAEKVNKDWERGLLNIKETLINVDAHVDKVLRSIAGFVSKLFGFKNASDVVGKSADLLGSFFDSLSKSIDSIPAETIIDLRGVFNDLVDAMKDVPKFIETLGDAIAMSQGKYEERWLEKREREMIKAAEKRTQISRNRRLSEEIKKMELVPVNDALITKQGKIVKFHPDDNIIASKGAPKVSHDFKSDIDVERIVRAIMREMKNEVKVEVVDVNLDSKKVGEAQVKISRY